MSKTKWWQIFNKTPELSKEPTVDFSNTAKLREFNSYLKRVSQYFNNPLNELLRQRGMILELIYVGKNNDQEKASMRLEVEKIDKMINQLLKE